MGRREEKNCLPFDTTPQQKFDDHENEEMNVASCQECQPYEHEEQGCERTVDRQEKGRMQRGARL